MNKFLYKTHRLINFYCYWKSTSNRTSPRLTSVDTNTAKAKPRKKTKNLDRYTKKGLANITQSAKDNYYKTLESGVMTNGVAKNSEAMTVRIGGSDIFRTEMAVLGGFHTPIVQPKIVQYDPHSKKAKKLLAQGKVPMAPLDELVGGEKFKFECIEVLQSDPTPPADEEKVEEEQKKKKKNGNNNAKVQLMRQVTEDHVEELLTLQNEFGNKWADFVSRLNMDNEIMRKIWNRGMSHLPRFLDENMQTVPLKDCVDENGNWLDRYGPDWEEHRNRLNEDIVVTDAPPATPSNLARLGQALGVKANSADRIEAVAELTLRRAGYQASSSNPVGGRGGTSAQVKARQYARYRKKHTYFKKGCTRKSATFFANGRTFRHYLEREGLWNKEYIRTLENDKGKKCQLDALLYEQGVKNVNRLDFNYIHYPQPVMK